VADCVGSLLAYDILCRPPSDSLPRHGSGATLVDASHSDSVTTMDGRDQSADACPSHHTDTMDEAAASDQFEFDVSEFFMLGSPMALVLAYRQLCAEQHYAGQLLAHFCLYNFYFEH